MFFVFPYFPSSFKSHGRYPSIIIIGGNDSCHYGIHSHYHTTWFFHMAQCLQYNNYRVANIPTWNWVMQQVVTIVEAEKIAHRDAALCTVRCALTLRVACVTCTQIARQHNARVISIIVIKPASYPQNASWWANTIPYAAVYHTHENTICRASPV